MRIVSTFLIGILAIVLASGCLRPPEYPVIPEISFNSAKVSQANIVTVRINFRDGDGDIGLNSDETSGIYRLGDSVGTTKPRNYQFNPYYNNYWVDILIKKKGIYRLLKFTTNDPAYNFFGFSGRVPLVSETSFKSKTAIEGYIDLDMDFSQATSDATNPSLTLANDTIKFEIRLIDRQLNISDTIETSPLVLFKK